MTGDNDRRRLARALLALRCAAALSRIELDEVSEHVAGEVIEPKAPPDRPLLRAIDGRR